VQKRPKEKKGRTKETKVDKLKTSARQFFAKGKDRTRGITEKELAKNNRKKKRGKTGPHHVFA
jgi:hypothetical protein